MKGALEVGAADCIVVSGISVVELGAVEDGAGVSEVVGVSVSERVGASLVSGSGVEDVLVSVGTLVSSFTTFGCTLSPPPQ